MAALILIEGCLLLGWQMLDTQGKQATEAQRWLYAALAWIAYFSLFGIALYHDEGVAGFAFRLTLGVMLVCASMEAGLLASIKKQDQSDKDIHKDWRVKRYARKLARQSVMADLDLAVKMRQLDHDAQEELYMLQQSRDTETQIQILQARASSDVPKRPEMAKSGTSTSFLDMANTKRKLTKEQALDKTRQLGDE